MRRTAKQRRQDRSQMIGGLLLLMKGLGIAFAVWYAFHR